ncbi:g7660 [Coccomyxa viridis]|uniref:G7660 protein n=1 Tax=Coccomyxa viridis TaxID=1274662 RepID=A0ABP1G101_9CHLO
MGTRAKTSAEASFSGRNNYYDNRPRRFSPSPLQVPSWPSRVPVRHLSTSFPDRKRHAVLGYDRNRKNFGDWNSSVEGERLKREVELQRQRLQELVQQQMQARPAWQTMLLPALGAGFFVLLLGPLFAVVLGAAALGASLVFSTAAFFILVPLALAALPLTFGLFAGAFVVKGLVLTLLNVLLVGGALTAGFRLTTKLLGSTPRESVERQAQAARAQTKGGVIDIEAKVMEDEARQEREEESVAQMNAEELRRFDQELEARTRQRDIDMGRRWKP